MNVRTDIATPKTTALTNEIALTFSNTSILVVEFRTPRLGEMGWWAPTGSVLSTIEWLIDDVGIQGRKTFGWIADEQDITHHSDSNCTVLTLRWL